MPVKSTRNLQFGPRCADHRLRRKRLRRCRFLPAATPRLPSLSSQNPTRPSSPATRCPLQAEPEAGRVLPAGHAQARAFFGGNRTGKTTCGAAEVAYHATGMYPPTGRATASTVRPLIWASGTSLSKTVEGVQKMLLGPQDNMGTGFIPGHRIAGRRPTRTAMASRSRTSAGGKRQQALHHLLQVLRAGPQGIEDRKVDVIWLDEEPPMDVYHECTMRLLGTDGKPGGIMLLTFTPLLGMSDVCRVFLRPVDPDDEDAISNGIVVASWADNTHLNEEEVEGCADPPRTTSAKPASSGVPSWAAA